MKDQWDRKDITRPNPSQKERGMNPFPNSKAFEKTKLLNRKTPAKKMQRCSSLWRIE